MKKTIYLLLLFSAILVNCRAPKILTTNTELKEQKDIENNISLIEALTVDQIIDQAMQKFFNEKLNVNINNKVYDTEKATDPETGKPPLIAETNINLSKETNETIAETVKTETTEMADSQLEDKSTDKSKIDSSEKTKTKTGLATWQKVLIVIGFSCVIGLILFIVSKIKKWL